MDPTDSQHVQAFREQLELWTDSRFVSAEDIYDLSMFSSYLVNLAEADGWEYVGHSFRVKQPLCLLVVRGKLDGTQHVVFTSARTYTGCVRIFLRKLREGWLEWSPDRFA
jgi:hypothetical protein